MAKDITLVIPKEKDEGAIYISNLQAAKSLKVLKEHRIGAIITVTKETKLVKENLFIGRYLHLPAEDRDDFDISQYFQASYSFIDEARKVTNVLVHCIAGISRSATIVAAYMMKKYSISSQNAINQLKKRREKVSPNKGFRKQLQLIKRSQSPLKLKKETFNISPIKIPMTMARSLPKQLISRQQTRRTFQQRLQMSSILRKKHQSPAMEQSIQMDKKQKIVKKIQKIKMSLVSKLQDTQDVKRKVKTMESQSPISFLHVLQNKIYQNKIKMKMSELM